MTGVHDTFEAFDKARARASVARHLEQALLHTAIYDAREAGLTAHQTAAALRVPIRTVLRHWGEWHQCHPKPPSWGNPSEYLAAQRAIWARTPAPADSFVPFEWDDSSDGSRQVRSVCRGIAVLKTAPSPGPAQ